MFCFWEQRINNWCLTVICSRSVHNCQTNRIIYGVWCQLIVCVPVQTAKFDEPVTLDFLDAELENDIKVKVWKMGFLNFSLGSTDGVIYAQ